MNTPASPPFRDPDRSVDERIGGLLGRLTLPEKLGLLHQHQAAVPRLGLDSFRTGTEALHGVAWLGPATVFPQAIGLATTWNPELVQAVGDAVGDEVRVFHQKDPAGVGLNVWAPVVNPLRDPRWGRNEEGFSEDPWLTGVIATAYGRGLIGDRPGVLKTAPALKHFLAYNNETDRCETSSNLPPRVLHDYELPAFRAPVQAGAAVAMMPSYNLVNGRPAHLSPLINEVVRGWTSDDLFVVSDAGAPANLFGLQDYLPDGPSAYAAALLAGVDSFTQDDADAGPSIQHLMDALQDGLLVESDIDTAVRHALAIRCRLGEFDPSELQPYRDLDPDLVNSPEHRELARDAARQSLVLLKNECQVLPLDAATTGLTAVIGPLADTLYEDWYAGTLPYRITALDGIVERLGSERVEFCEGVDRIALQVAGTGLRLTVGVDGQLKAAADGPAEDGWFDLFDWGGGAWALRSVRNGRHLTAMDDGGLVADQPGPNGWEVKQTFELIRTCEATVLIRHLNSGQFLQVDNLEVDSLTVDGLQVDGAVRLAEREQATAFELEVVVDGAAAGAELAARAGTVIVVVGNHPLVNGRETEDRAELELPAAQERLVRAVHAANSRTVLVMSSSYPFSVCWPEQNLPALLWSAHGGQEYGRALADVLFGDSDPGGRLPQTWYRSAADLPDLLDYDIVATDATYLYFRGTPLYPFGHGLSYTSFTYSEPAVSTPSMGPDGEAQISCTVTNTGARAGHEVVQLYTHQQRSRVKQPLRQLRDFQRLTLAPGESRRVELTLTAADLAFYDVTRDRPCIETARHSILIGRSCTDTRLTATVDVIGERIPVQRLTAKPLAAVNFDQYCAMTLTAVAVDRGDATRAVDAGGWLGFDDIELPVGRFLCTARVSNGGDATGVLELRLDDPLRGELLGSCDVSPQTWTDLPFEVTSTQPAGSLYVVFSTAGISLETLTFEQIAPSNGA